MAAEMRRMRLPTEHYRMTALNESYQLCPSYPAQLFVPAQVNGWQKYTHKEKGSSAHSECACVELAWHCEF